MFKKNTFAVPYIRKRMYAIVKIAGQQFKVEENQEIFVHRLAAEEGETIEVSDVLLVDQNGSVQIGAPLHCRSLRFIASRFARQRR